MISDDECTLRLAYDAYNRQDSYALLALLSLDVDWPDGDTWLHGREEVRKYHRRQWRHIRTHDHVIGVSRVGRGSFLVRIDQTVQSVDGSIVSRGYIEHVHTLRDGLIARLEIPDTAWGHGC